MASTSRLLGPDLSTGHHHCHLSCPPPPQLSVPACLLASFLCFGIELRYIAQAGLKVSGHEIEIPCLQFPSAEIWGMQPLYRTS